MCRPRPTCRARRRRARWCRPDPVGGPRPYHRRPRCRGPERRRGRPGCPLNERIRRGRGIRSPAGAGRRPPLRRGVRRGLRGGPAQRRRPPRRRPDRGVHRRPGAGCGDPGRGRVVDGLRPHLRPVGTGADRRRPGRRRRRPRRRGPHHGAGLRARRRFADAPRPGTARDGGEAPQGRGAAPGRRRRPVGRRCHPPGVGRLRRRPQAGADRQLRRAAGRRRPGPHPVHGLLHGAGRRRPAERLRGPGPDRRLRTVRGLRPRGGGPQGRRPGAADARRPPGADRQAAGGAAPGGGRCPLPRGLRSRPRGRPCHA